MMHSDSENLPHAPLADDGITTVPPDLRPTLRSADHRVARGLWNWVLPLLFLLSMMILLMYATPYLLLHWRMLEAQGDAEAIFMKRRAELRAEAEHADARLVQLDKRLQLTSLGFREVVRKVAPHVVNVTCFKALPKGHLVEGKRVLDDPATNNRFIETSAGSGILVRPGVVLTNQSCR